MRTLFYKKSHRTHTPKDPARCFIRGLYETQPAWGADAPAAIPARWASFAQIMQLLARVIHEHHSVDAALEFLGVAPLAPEDVAVRRCDVRVLAREVPALVPSLRSDVMWRD